MKENEHESMWASKSVQQGRAIAQEASRRLYTAAARVRAQIRSCGICGGQSGIGVGFLRVHRFSMPILIPPAAPHSSSIIRGWYNRPESGRRTKWTQSHSSQPQEAKKKLNSVQQNSLSESNSLSAGQEISVHNATYIFPPSPFHFHNMFRLYMAIIKCSFAKHCFTLWYI
jgi:hypothetical protein